MREVSRNIQELRKQQGKGVSERVRVSIDCDEGLFKRWKSFLESETTSEVALSKLAEGKKVSLKDLSVKISL